MAEVRVLFERAPSGSGFNCRLQPNWDMGLAQPIAFDPFLDEDDYEDLRWYLEDYMDLPLGGNQERATRIEAALESWGKRLYDALFGNGDHRDAINQLHKEKAPHFLTIATRESDILRLPWELIADGRGPLTRRDIVIRRQVERAGNVIEYKTGLPLRILLVVSRPMDTGFIDPRLTTRSILDALESLGSDVDVDFCRPPTLARLEEMLDAAHRAGKPYHIMHFEGHGVFVPEIALGALCFEKPDEATVLASSKTDFVRADRLGAILAKYSIPLVILEACRSGAVNKLPVFRSVAPQLIDQGVGTVLAMSHSVHVEATRILLDRFYRELVAGCSVGEALEHGRAALIANPARWLERGPGGKTVELKDWFLPNLYQRGEDLRLVPKSKSGSIPPPSSGAFQYDAFLSYTHTDADRVRRIHQLLTARGLSVFLDEREMDAGPLHAQCEKGIENSRYVLLACSQRALASDWVMAEHDMARGRDPRGKRIVPLALDSTELPLALRALFWCDFREPSNDEAGIERLATIIGRRTSTSVQPRTNDRRTPAATGEVGAFPRPPIYGFHGRASELYEIERQLRAHRAVVLHAMGGMGKTTFATEAGHWWTRTGLFPDGACFVSFESFSSAERVIQVLGEYLDGKDFNSRPIEDQFRRAKRLFNEKRVLLVWDNFESVLPEFNKDTAVPALYSDDERQRLYDLFRDFIENDRGNGRLLITCRPAETGLLGARQSELSGLQRADSLSLLVRVMQTAGVNMNAHELTREKLSDLLELLADHPLSIELVGPHLRKLTPEEIGRDFGKLLAEFNRGAGKERNESLLASLAFSTKRLSPAAQKVLPWLGLFKVGVFEKILLDVSEITPEAWEAIRGELEATALVRVERDVTINGKPYLRFHPTLGYVASTSELANLETVRRSLVEAYHTVAFVVREELLGTKARGGIVVMEREEANVRAAVGWALAAGNSQMAANVGEVCCVYLEWSGRLRERDAWATWLRREVSKQGFTKAAAETESNAAWALFTQGRAHEAVHKLESLLDRLHETREFDARFEVAFARMQLGRVLGSSGLDAQAIPLLEEAAQEWQALIVSSGDNASAEKRGNLAVALGGLADSLMDTGRLDEALAISERALAINIALHRDREVAAGHGQCAQVLLRQGRIEEADVRLTAALQAAHRAGDKLLVCGLLQHQGTLASHCAKFERALGLYQEALKGFLDMHDDRGVMSTCNQLGVVEMQQGRLAEAQAWYLRSKEVAQKLGDRPALAAAAHNLGIACQVEGDAAREQGNESLARVKFSEAARFGTDGLNIVTEIQQRPSQASSHGQLATVYFRLGELDQAEHHAHQALQIHEELGLREVVLEYKTLAQIAHARGNETEAAAWESKRDAALAAQQQRAQGPGGLPPQFIEAVQSLAVECAQAAVEHRQVNPNAEGGLAQLDQLPAPMPELSSFLRHLASRSLSSVPAGLPAELSDWLTQLVAAVREELASH